MLAGAMHRFIYLKAGLSIVLIFVGLKMLSDKFYHMPIYISLGVIGAVLIVAIGASLVVTRRRPPAHGEPSSSEAQVMHEL